MNSIQHPPRREVILKNATWPGLLKEGRKKQSLPKKTSWQMYWMVQKNKGHE